MSGKQKALTPVVVQMTPSEISLNEKDRTQAIINLHSEIGRNLCLVLKISQLSFEKILQIGKLLNEQKEALQHGEFGPWVEQNLPFSHRSVNRYMKMYRRRHELKLDRVANLSQAYRCWEMLPYPEQENNDVESNEKLAIIIPPNDDRNFLIADALKKAMEIYESNSRTTALYHIASDWFDMYIDETEPPPLQEKIRAIEKAYNVKLTIQPNEGN